MPAPTLSPEAPVSLPQWSGTQLFCSTRQGGVSQAPYDSLNLGDHVGDQAEHVAHNRRFWAESCAVKPVFLQQVHGTDVLQITPQTPDGAVADACWTSTPGLACTIMVADCLPVLFHSPTEKKVAAAHAGWRGLAAGVLEQTLRVFSNTQHLRVWFGPCIGPSAFEVGAEVRAAFVSANPWAETAFQALPTSGKYLADLPALARQRLAKMGVTQAEGNDGSLSWCTFSQAGLFYSHRRDGVSGRFAAGISLI